MFNNNNNYNSQGVPSFMAYGGVPVGLPKGAVPQNATGGAVPQWALGQQNQTSPLGQPTQLAQNNTQANDSNCYMTFDGKNLELYKNGSLVNNLDGMSGQTDYQNRASQSIPNKGPIPEGTYYANQDQRQNIDFRNAAFGIVGAGAWPGSIKSWGLRRVWLQPDADTNTYGRTNLSIHGGLSKGSRGCIDIPWQTNQLSNFMNGCPNSIPVYVKYTKESW